MVFRWMGAALALVLASGAMAQAPVPTYADIARVNDGRMTSRLDAEAEIDTWERDLRIALRQGTPQSAADAVASVYGFSASDSRRLVNAWIIVDARHHFGRGDQGWRQAVRAELIALAATARRSPVGLAVIAEALDRIEDCAPADFDALLADSDDRARDAYRIVSAAPCDASFERALLAEPDRATATLIRWLKWGTIPPPAQIAAYDWLTSPSGLGRIDDADRPAMATFLRQRHLAVLIRNGFITRALALFDSLSPLERMAVLAPDSVAPTQATVDDIAMITAPRPSAVTQGKPGEAAPRPPLTYSIPSPPAPIQAVAEALAIAGREPEARAVLATLPRLAEAKAAAACRYAARNRLDNQCGNFTRLPMRAVLLDHWLNTRTEDPYPLAEASLDTFISSDSLTEAAIRCRLFATASHPSLCDEADAQVFPGARFRSEPTEQDRRIEAALAQVVPDYEARRAAVMQDVRPSAPTAPSHPYQGTVAALPPGFPEKPLPAAHRGTAPAEPPADMAALPEGYYRIRAERDGQRAVAISVSRALDATGAHARGGYWVHLSDGKTWQRPLYTGLADRFPYVVTRSTMPLIAGDTLHLAVDVDELDTASIGLPPTLVRTRRRADNLYLEIPLATLRRDSDGDGLTDLVERHLLLDRAKGARRTPFLVGSDAASCAGAPPPSSRRRAMIALLGKISPDRPAIVEPIDTPVDGDATALRSSTVADHPLLLLGKASDFACLRTSRPIIVYDETDLADLNRHTPDFRPLRPLSIVFNRAGDRGYAHWWEGWRGGTYRIRLIDGDWTIQPINEWVS